MIQESSEHLLIRKYLLGQLTEEDQDKVELRLLSDTDFIEDVAIEQNKLYDDYVRGGLLENDRKAFEHQIQAVPERFEKLRFTKALQKYVDQAVEPDSFSSFTRGTSIVSIQQRLSATFRSNIAGLTLATALILVAVMLFWLFNQRQQSRDNQARLEDQRKALAVEIARLNEGATTPSPQSTIYIGPLQPGLVRGAADKKEAVRAKGATIVQLRLDLPMQMYQSYRASLHAIGVGEVFTVDGLKSVTENNSKVLLLNIPASILSFGDYQLALSGLTPSGEYEEVGVYSFRIIRP